MSKDIVNKDIIIIGSGPAGLTAGIYAGRSKLDTLILEDEIVGGQIIGTYAIENYPGFHRIGGSDFAGRLASQAADSGARIEEFDTIVSVNLTDNEKKIETSGKIYNPLAVIIATGSKHRPLPIPEEQKFHGKGIHYCELCDGEMYTDKHVLVVGGGNSGVEAAIYLSKYASQLTLIHWRDSLTAEKSSIEDLTNNPKIKVLYNTEILSANGEDSINSVMLKNNKTNEEYEYEVDGIFTYVGMVPRTELFKEYIELNKDGYIKANENTETNIKGVFAAGDVREKSVRQLTTAVADGTVSALMAEKYILQLRRK
ncbi:NAD(P)/FAD-dependent oxidoreductase [Clostridium cylindrosporum]|uniref:FAD/NAD(P)-binding domain-containing protein n=1 Tax=Clostridium cylindrosporum DSM 605 TaxID=1121307 RepID=A0A0J8D9X9_CLOCY|nr:FAD-dependent oxidoreductase [Clostridium cylindrosporum]KMT21098.1 hypothetical protein CLCY_1c03320 [Clostridium cylindrosporum DSM 605]